MNALPSIGEALRVNAQLYPERVAASSSTRSLTFRQWNERSCRLANALLGLGIAKGDRVAVIAYNCIEWLEIYTAIAKAGLIAVPINFRLLSDDVLYIADNAEARAVIVQRALIDRIEPVRDALDIDPDRYVLFGGAAGGDYRDYEGLIAAASASEPEAPIYAADPFALMYTSGTTGKPKGALRTHGATALLSLVSAVEFGFTRQDNGLLVMPLCHANSLFFIYTFAYIGAACTVYDRRSVDAEDLLRSLSEQHCSFTSLVPTHYVMMGELPAATKQRYPANEVSKLLISSAPARESTKLAIMEQFHNSSLFEMYGSTEAGWVTALRPDEQFAKLGSIGRELVGTGRVRLLDDNGEDVAGDAIGELFSYTPYAFEAYWRLPEKTAEAFRGAYCSVGDMARRDADGFLYLVDRKTNMIISGGENVYPSEVENVLAAHPAVQDVAVIGVPDDKWGEAIHAVIVPRPGAATDVKDILDWCAGRIAGYKRPRSAEFISEQDMPRTATGKVLHRVLRDRRHG